MSIERFENITKLSQLRGMVLTEEEKAQVTIEDIEELFLRLNRSLSGVYYCADRLFGNIGWDEEYFYD
ncbi:hypothetical protein [Gleimia coleocanis]|nr:hypothetical protein [Gleimia coleocanis]